MHTLQRKLGVAPAAIAKPVSELSPFSSLLTTRLRFFLDNDRPIFG
jgi:hypothetical protein